MHFAPVTPLWWCFGFMRIPLIAVVGWAFYGEQLDIFVLLGALIIVAGVLWNLRSRVARAQ